MKKDQKLEGKRYIKGMKEKVEGLGFKFKEYPKYRWQVFAPLYVTLYNRGKQT